MMKEYKPFTYRIAWSNKNLHYYGVRYAKTAHPDELWNTYFTSSRVVARLRKNFGEPDIIEVRKTFDSKRDAIEWEFKVLSRLKVNLSEHWVNQCVSPGINSDKPWNKGLFGLKTNYPKHRKSSGPITDEKRQKLKEAALQQWQTKSKDEIDSIKEKMSNNTKGRIPWNKGQVGKQVAWNKGIQQKEWTCEFCGKQGRGAATYSRWHGKNCRQKQ